MEAIQTKVEELLNFNDPKGSYAKRRRMWKSRLVRQREERDAARAFKLGRGRGLAQHS